MFMYVFDFLVILFFGLMVLIVWFELNVGLDFMVVVKVFVVDLECDLIVGIIEVVGFLIMVMVFFEGGLDICDMISKVL